MTRPNGLLSATALALALAFTPACGDSGGDGGTDSGSDNGSGNGSGNGSSNGGGGGGDNGGSPIDDDGDPEWLSHEMTSSSDHDWSIPDTAPEADADCNPVDDGLYGSSYEWMGWEHDGTLYTCNSCPGGKEAIQGYWRAIYDWDDPTEPHPKGDALTVEIVGNTWFLRDERHGQDGDEYVEVFGWYFCGSQPEIHNETTVFVATSVEPEGEIGWTTGVPFSADVLVASNDEWAWNQYLTVLTVNDGTGWFDEILLCRVGTEYVTDWFCPDPF